MKQLPIKILSTLLAVSPLISFADAVISIDAGDIIAPVKPWCFGNNLSGADSRGIYVKMDSPKTNLRSINYAGGYWNPLQNAPFENIAALVKNLKIGMMRYPGGCLAHNFNWKHAVGPLSERREWKFGVDQYIALCRAMNWEPIITLTDYALPPDQLPRHLAEFVEYLNAPALPQYPWAMKRAAWGHPEPYGVRYFELGNESCHGNHLMVPKYSYTPEEYVEYAVKSMEAIRNIDSSVKLGIVTRPGNGIDWNCEWNRKVIKGAGPTADFLVLHFYGPTIGGADQQTALKSVLAYPDQLAMRLKQYSNLCRELAGKPLPLHITEFNIGSTSDRPFPYRFSFLAGLMCADLMRLWQAPDNHVASAQYWHLLNGFWGAVHTQTATGRVIRKRATLPFFEVWGRYRGDRIVASTVRNSPSVSFLAGCELMPSTGTEYIPAELVAELEKIPLRLNEHTSDRNIRMSPGKNDTFQIQIAKMKQSCYRTFARIRRPKAATGKPWKIVLSFDARFLSDAGHAAEAPQATFGLGLGDARGWTKTKSAVAIPCTFRAGEWSHCSGIYLSLPDTDEVDILFRLEKIRSAVSGTFEVRNLKAVVMTAEQFPAYPALATFSSLSNDGNTLYLLVFNRDPEHAVRADVVLNRFPARSGKSLELYRKDVNSCDYFQGRRGEQKLSGGRFFHTFPAHSLTAFEWRKE